VSNKIEIKKAMKIINLIIVVFLVLCSAKNIFAQKEIQHPTKVVSCSVCNNTAISLPKPEYPKAARAVNASGAVTVRILIDEKGIVESAKAVSGHPLLWAESVKVALKAKFKPLLLSGNAVKVYGEIVYNFVQNEMFPKIQAEKKTKISQKSNNVVRSKPRSILIGKATKLVKPLIPFCNCRFGNVKSISSVIIQVEIDEQGNVNKAVAISGHPILRQTTEQAARKSKFSPTLISGEAVKAKAFIIYRFIIVDKWSVKFKDISVKDIQIENQPTN